MRMIFVECMNRKRYLVSVLWIVVGWLAVSRPADATSNTALFVPPTTTNPKWYPLPPHRHPLLGPPTNTKLRNSRQFHNTRLQMVFAPPESVVEQVSTQDLIDIIIDDCLRTSARRPIMVQFNPSSRAIWRHWRGTVISETWKSCLQHAIWTVIVYLIFQWYPHTMKNLFSGFHILWAEILSVTTFTLTFFVNTSFTVWKTCLTTCRVLQGQLNDVIMTLSGFAKREDMNSKDFFSKTSSSHFTPRSKKILTVVSRYIRLFNILYYASLTRSHRPLLTPRGMRRMTSRGLMTNKEYKLLMKAPGVSATQRQNVVLMWIYRTIVEARNTGHISSGYGFEQEMIATIKNIRSSSSSVESTLRGRMPFAYAHIVQVLIDIVLWMYPLSSFSEGMNMSFHLTVLGTVLLTSSYQGLFDLAKHFLDPFHNENFWRGEDALVVNTLIAETNAGSMRWMNGLDEMPISFSDFKSGKLDAHILPNGGYEREDADRIDEELWAVEREEKLQEEQQRYTETVVMQPNGIGNMNQKDKLMEYFEGLAAGELEAVQEEFETTKRILNAPPGFDFVPGVDDKNMTTPYEDRESDNNGKNKKNKNSVTENFMDAIEGEFQETKGMLEETYNSLEFEEGKSLENNDRKENKNTTVMGA